MSEARRLKREPDQLLVYNERFRLAATPSFMTQPTAESFLRVASVLN